MINITRFSLNGEWILKNKETEIIGNIPGSVYSFFLNNDLMEDPYYRDNEIKALSLMDFDYEFIKRFKHYKNKKTILCFDGIDTVSKIYLNGVFLGETANMHRKYEFDVTDILKEDNELKVFFPSITEKFRMAYKKEAIFTEPSGPLAGARSFRKAFCMSGWDWGPRLPDMGIWKDVYLLDCSTSRILDFEIIQKIEKDMASIVVNTEFEGKATLSAEIVSPSGEIILSPDNRNFIIHNPLLWWPNGYGEHPLYEVKVSLIEDGNVVDCMSKKIGIRTIELVREPDEYGESYYHRVNGVSIFAKGACYIPEDNILSRCSRERTEKLINACLFSNFNTIRVWGGGYYPNDYFYDLCDEKGLLIFEDLMYACSMVSVDRALQKEFLLEVEENLKRIRHHACITVICGNNEMEWFTDKNSIYGEIYLKIFEDNVPKIVNKTCGYIPYVSSSPTSHGSFEEPNNENIGDCHYWDVWLGNKPFSEYRKKYFRYLSEFGFESLPDIKTINSFTEKSDRNLFSRIMERHQRCIGGNKKIIEYISDTYRYPTSLEKTVYVSQLLQSDAMKYGVEHMRSNRGRCMGALYWQLNDIWPVASWSSIDYYGRYKALQYFAKRFFAPVILVCKEIGEHTTRDSVVMQDDLFPYSTKAQLFVCNETCDKISGTVMWELRNNYGEIITSSQQDVLVDEYSFLTLDEIDFNKTDVLNNYFSFSFLVNGEIISSGTSLFTVPKHFNFVNPELEYKISGDKITVFAKAFAKSVCISSDDDIVLSDNYFDLNADSKTVTVLSGNIKNIRLTSVYDI